MSAFYHKYFSKNGSDYASHVENVSRTYDLVHEFIDEKYTALTDGIYNGDETIDYNLARQDQIAFLLDETKVTKGTRLLGVGSGYGDLLEAANQRGAHTLGLTLSEAQENFCKKKGLNVKLLDWRKTPQEFFNSFDVIIANGSMEHFPAPIEILNGCQNDVYIRFFDYCYKMLDKNSTNKRIAITCCYLNKFQPKFEQIYLQDFKIGTDEWRTKSIQRSLGGWYPENDQVLIEAASSNFKLIKQVDGTEDYYITSTKWRSHTLTLTPKKLCNFFLYLLHAALNPKEIKYSLIAYYKNVWTWQFEGYPNSPFGLTRIILKAKEK